MNSIFSINGLTFKEANLLFCLEKEIIENDISFSQQNEDEASFQGKEIWFTYWQKEINKILENLTELSPKGSLSLLNVDKKVLYDEVSNQTINIKTSWRNKMLQRCRGFIPYNWYELISRNKDGANDLLLYQRAYPDLLLNEHVREETLRDIAVFLLSSTD